LNRENNGGRWGLRNPDQLLAVIQGAGALLAAGMPEAARALLAPFTGGGARRARRQTVEMGEDA